MHIRNSCHILVTVVALLLVSRPADASILANFFPGSSFNANSSTMDATLGVTGFQIDTFESTTLLTGLTISLSGNVTATTETSLPNLFNVNTDGDSFETNNQWDGTDVATNSPTNRIGVPTFAALTTFNYAAGATSFGIGLSNFQSTSPASPFFPITQHELFVNGVDLGVIETLAGANWSPGIVRNAYLRVDATGGSTITSVGIQNNTVGGGSTSGDFLIFDHLAIQAATQTAVPEPGTFGLLAATFALAGCFAIRVRRSQ
jgi:hypothetical protein